MVKTLENIKNLASSLPNKDIEIAKSLIERRDFESLKELVSSAIIKVQRNLNGESPKKEYLELDLEKMITLESEVTFYLDLLDIDSKWEPTERVSDDIYEEHN